MICSSIGPKGITNIGISFFILMKRLYIVPQKKKFSGVMMGEKAVVMAVIETDRAVLPFDSAERKLEILPPGHDAIRIIPKATMGVIRGFKANATVKVTAGRKNHG